MNMGPRNLLILFFSAVAVSLVILIILSSLVFKNLSLDFNTHLPESTPDIGRQFSTQTQSMNPDSKADNVSRATVNVPPESVEPAVDGGKADAAAKAEQTPAKNAPVSDDSILENDAPLPLGDTVEPDETPVPATPKSMGERPPAPKNPAPVSRTPRVEPRRAEPLPAAYPVDIPSSSSQESSGPPVPGQ